MLILAIIAFGFLAGWLAQLILGRRGKRDYAQALVIGLAGSFIGGLLGSLLDGDGLRIRPSGLIGSVIGAVILLAIIDAVQRRRRPAPQPKGRSKSGSKSSAKRRR
jgi:uncharacterized membrane protein YeaQ/YmgE (transglycosylase-associated protein family)